MGILLLHFDRDVLSDEWMAEIEANAGDMEVVVTRDRDEIQRILDDIEVVAGWWPYELFLRGRSLRWVQQWGAGADWLTRRPEYAQMGFTLTNVSGVHAIPISEHILAFLFAFARDFKRAMRGQTRREWLHSEDMTVFELAGKTLLLVGVGAIGARTAELASALGMRVLGVRRNAALSAPGVDAMFSLDSLPDILPQADFVVLTVPLTHETRGMIGEPELRAMKPSAYIVNIGRGGTIRQDELIRALQESWIAGAGLDVFDPEPLPDDSPLWEMDNVIITSHYSGLTPHYMERAMAIFLDNLRRYTTGEPLRNVVDKELGY